ncbi:MAG: N-acetyltransferase family protein [Nitrososphaerales archaeon]
MEIRPLRGDEVEELIGLWKEFMNDSLAMDEPIPTHERNVRKQKEFVTKLMKEDPGQVLVATDGDKLVGYLLFQNEVRPPLKIAHGLSYVTDLYVRPKYRRQGIAKRLLQSCLDSLRRRRATSVQLKVWHTNSGAIALYRQLGFEDLDITMRLVI